MHRNSYHCNNCGKKGHVYMQCKFPITSIGIIGFRYNKELRRIQYLLIRRKDTLGYVDFVRGKYIIQNRKYIQNIVDEMTTEEKNKLMTQSFETIWKDLWGLFKTNQYRNEEKVSRNKFNELKRGVNFLTESFDLKTIIENSSTNWNEPEWGFPKGRRNDNERDIDTAIREFCEETGYTHRDFKVIENIVPYEEIFSGSNFKSYNHKYFVGFIHNPEYNLDNFQDAEVSAIEWFTLEEAVAKIRPYNLEKVRILNQIEDMLNKLSIIHIYE